MSEVQIMSEELPEYLWFMWNWRTLWGSKKFQVLQEAIEKGEM